MKNEILIALDGIHSFYEVNEIVHKLYNHVDGFKITDLADRYGPKIVNYLKKYGKVMVDLKINDIPNTIKNRLKIWDESGADLITLYANKNNLLTAKETLKYSNILAFSKLTSDEFDISYNYEKIIKMCEKYQTHGLVIGIPYLKRIKNKKKYKVKFATPGIRLMHDQKNDQKNFGTIKEAINNKSSYLIIGRSITNSNNPVEKIKNIKKDII